MRVRSDARCAHQLHSPATTPSAATGAVASTLLPPPAQGVHTTWPLVMFRRFISIVFGGVWVSSCVW